MRFVRAWMDKLWDLAARRGARKVLGVVSFTEAVFFPIPPDLFLIPMAMSNRDKSFSLAWLCLWTSLLGGVLGYFLGYFFMQSIGFPILEFYGLMDKYQIAHKWYDRYDAWAVALAGFTPLPYKVCTLTAGAFQINWPVFVVASALSRGGRFFILAGLIKWKGEQAREFVEKRFDLLLILALVVGVLGFVVLKFL
ncbi:MAG: YqaA family protein [Desulfonatronovibrionaceae bacterium]